jgi:hypothetical protein
MLKKGRRAMQQAWFDETKIETDPEFVAFVGIDWADEEHAWCWQKVEEISVRSACRPPKPERWKRGSENWQDVLVAGQ